MYQNRRNVLVIGVNPDEFDRVTPFLGRDAFEVDRFPSASGALELTTRVSFEVLLVRFPLPDMDLYDYLQAVRQEGSPCQRASILLLTQSDKAEEAESFIGRGANRVVKLEDTNGKIQAVISSLLNVAPRKAARFLARLEIKLGGAKDMILCQTENLSASGMLIKTDKRYDTGTRINFEFTLPEDQRPIVGIAEIVRHTMIGRDKVGGIGVRFLSFAGDSQRRYEAFVERL